ncbi:MAG: iron transporter [Moraxellaceae bacterium]|nr:MAG: iron transporter [Moraxellaceae bacterium]
MSPPPDSGQDSPNKTPTKAFAMGPGIVMAATGLGAGDLVAATVSGAKFGVVILWVAVLGAVLKLALNEGLARWQLATQTSLITGWIQHLPTWVHWYFLGYLVLWSFLVAAAIMAACGIAAHALFPQLSVAAWGILHSLTSAVLVGFFNYQYFERLMKLLIALMFVVVLYAAFKLLPPLGLLFSSLLIPTIPENSIQYLLGVIGGVGGSVTLLCYGYWISEKNWLGADYVKVVRTDLSIAYALTGLFAVAIIIIAARLHPDMVKGPAIVVAMADEVGRAIGTFGRWCFLLGFWGAVFSSMLGVWQGVPYLFEDLMQHKKPLNLNAKANTQPFKSRSRYYGLFLLFLTLPPASMLLLGKPVWLIIVYSVAGAFFMPFLAVTLLYMTNNKQWMGDLKSGGLSNIFLGISLILFILLLAKKFIGYF